jgi:peptidyl-prolyl cis-trans isomerase SurA
MMVLFRSALAGIFLIFGAGMCAAQSIVVLVNDEPITSYDVAQRERFLALTSGLGDKLKARLQSEETKEKFRAFMTKERPTSKEEAQALQKKFVAGLQQEVLSSSAGSMRKQAIEQLVDERLMLQAAKDNKIIVTEDEVTQTLTRMAEGGQRKLSLNEFLDQFNEQGVNPSTLKAKIQSQIAWRQVIRRVYGSRVQSSVSTVETVSSNDSDAAAVDVRVVSLTVPAKAEQSVVAQRLLDADQIRQRFTSCDKLDAIVKGVQGASAKPVKSGRLSEFRGDVKAALEQAQPGQMTPPVIVGAAIESHALCAKKQTVAAGKNTEKKPDPNADKTQEEFQLYSKRHLKDLKDHARLDYPKSG